MKKAALLLFLACLLCGCAQPGVQENRIPVSTTEVMVDSAAEKTAAPLESTEESTAPAEEPVVLEAVNVYGFRSSKEKPAVAVIDHRTAAFLTAEYPDKDYSRKCTRVQVVDLYTDTLKAETLLEGTYTPLDYCHSPGNLALEAPETQEVIVLDRMLQEVLTFSAQGAEGVLTEDLGKYYFPRGNKICFQDTDTGDSGAVYLDHDLTFHEVLGYDAGENILLVSAYYGLYASDMCIGAVDLDTEEFVLLYQDVTGGSMADQGVLLERENIVELCSDVYYGDWTDSELCSLPGFLVNDLNYAAWHVAGTDYVFRIAYDKVRSVDIVEFELYHLGETISVCSLQEKLDGAKITQTYALPDGNLLALEITGRGYRPYLICTELLEFTDVVVETSQGAALVDVTLTEEASQVLPYALPQELEAVRLKADTLEEKYDVTILISSECTPALEASGMTITTTDLANLPDEAGTIEDALEMLDDVLALYPGDFFRQFRNEAGERGLLVLLVENFEADMDIIGLSYGMGQWYPVAVDITSGQVNSTYCHEIWHATENRIYDLNQTALDLAAWKDCNPAGFRYSGNMTSSYIEDTQYTYFFGNPKEGVHFVDPYAKINGHEDRARLMEFVMCSDWQARMILEHPAMRQKLQILCDAIRQAFDTEQWEKVHWERFF